MTVSSTTSRVSYAGNGSTTNFAVPFYFLEEDALLVKKVNTDTLVETTLALTTNYTVDGEGDLAGGSITCLVAPTASEELVIIRDPDFLQEVDYRPNDKFPAETTERALDKLAMQDLRLLDKLALALSRPDSAVDENYDAGGRQISGLEDATEEDQAATLGQVEDMVDQILTGGSAVAPRQWLLSGDNSETEFTLAGADVASAIAYEVYISGVRQIANTDYTFSLGSTTLTFSSAPPTGTNNIEVVLRGYAKGISDAGSLRTELASSAGAGLVGMLNGNTVEFTIGNIKKLRGLIANDTSLAARTANIATLQAAHDAASTPTIIEMPDDGQVYHFGTGAGSTSTRLTISNPRMIRGYIGTKLVDLDFLTARDKLTLDSLWLYNLHATTGKEWIDIRNSWVTVQDCRIERDSTTIAPSGMSSAIGSRNSTGDNAECKILRNYLQNGQNGVFNLYGGQLNWLIEDNEGDSFDEGICFKALVGNNRGHRVLNNKMSSNNFVSFGTQIATGYEVANIHIEGGVAVNCNKVVYFKPGRNTNPTDSGGAVRNISVRGITSRSGADMLWNASKTMTDSLVMLDMDAYDALSGCTLENILVDGITHYGPSQNLGQDMILASIGTAGVMRDIKLRNIHCYGRDNTGSGEFPWVNILHWQGTGAGAGTAEIDIDDISYSGADALTGSLVRIDRGGLTLNVGKTKVDFDAAGTIINHSASAGGTNSIKFNRRLESTGLTAGTAGAMNSGGGSTLTQLGQMTARMHIGDVAAATDFTLPIFSPAKKVIIQACRLINAATVTASDTNYSSYQLRGSNNINTITTQVTGGTAITNLTPATIPVGGRYLTNSNEVIRLVKTHTGTGSALTNATIEVDYTEAE